jgi:hypothetical protein
MYAQIKISYKQNIIEEEIPLFRNASQQELDRIINKYRKNVIEIIEDEFEGKDIEIEVILVDK